MKTPKISKSPKASKTRKKPVRSGDWLGPVGKTSRGFEIIEFEDRYGAKCSLQQSSLAEVTQPGWSAVWLGIEDANPQIMKSTALKLGMKLPPGEVSGWMPYPIPDDVLLTTRMHLSYDQVKALIERLQRWVEGGSFAARRKKGHNVRFSDSPSESVESKETP